MSVAWKQKEGTVANRTLLHLRALLGQTQDAFCCLFKNAVVYDRCCPKFYPFLKAPLFLKQKFEL